MIQKRIDEIDISDIENLVLNQVPEDRSLDYKQELPQATDSGRKEFAKDVSAFANTDGGDLVFGVKETRDASKQPTGRPQSVCGLQNYNADAVERRLTQILLAGVRPRIPGVRFQHIADAGNNSAMVVRVPRSYSGPHMVTLQDDNRFYRRDPRGTHTMDWDELRDAYSRSSELVDRVRRWREDRIEKIKRDTTPVALLSGPKLILHIVPWASFSSYTTNVLEALDKDSLKPLVRPSQNPVIEHPGYNLDGLYRGLLHQDPDEWFSYIMIFREGMIEKVDADYLRDKIYRPELERHILDDIREGLRLLGGIGLTAPYSVMLTIIGARDLRLPELDYGRSYGKPMNADMAVAPDAVIAEYDPNVSDTRIMPAMRNAFNYLWNGFGIAKDPQYTPEGQWIPRQS